MIVPLYDTTTTQVADKLVAIRRDWGAVALSRVLTLLVPVGAAHAEGAIAAANQASMEHPCRVIVIVERDRQGESTLDAEIRVGGDAGASEVVVLRLRGALVDHQSSLIAPLLLPDAPIVAWWPDRLPSGPADAGWAAVAAHRVTDSVRSPRPADVRLRHLAATYTPGDTDMAWTRLTWWRAHLAAILDRPPYEPVTGALVRAEADHPSAHLLAAWLELALGAPVRREDVRGLGGITRVELNRDTGPVILDRPDGAEVATLTTPGHADQRFHLARRSVADCLSEELRRLDEDRVYGAVLRHATEQP